MPERTSGSWSTSTVSYLAPSRSRIVTARLEKPHCGNSAVPFMNRTMSLLFTSSSMRDLASPTGCLRVRHCGFELQCVKLSPSSPPESGIGGLMLLDAAPAGETAAPDAGCIMVPGARKIADDDFSVGNGRLVHPPHFDCRHWHQ